jgi:hypothetical protein
MTNRLSYGTALTPPPQIPQYEILLQSKSHISDHLRVFIPYHIIPDVYVLQLETQVCIANHAVYRMIHREKVPA